MRFAMETDSRARRVAKDLRALLAERGIKLATGRAYHATARIFGYAGWKELLESLGAAASPDDVEAGEAEGTRRRQVLLAVLSDLGLDGDAAATVAARLAPTARDAVSVDAAPQLVVPVLDNYHPYRFLNLITGDDSWQSTLSASGNLRRKMMGEGNDAWRLVDPAMWIASRYVQEVRDEALTPLDHALVHRDLFESVLHSANFIYRKTHFIVDASAVAAGMAGEDVSSLTWHGGAGERDGIYFHFGTHALPSPFPGCGIEGCYLSFWGEGPDHIEMKFVVSPETVPGMDHFDVAIHNDFEDNVTQNIRHLSVGFTPVYEDDSPRPKLSSALDTEAWDGEYGEEYAEAWAPYVPAAVNAAWNCLLAYDHGLQPRTDAVTPDADPDLVLALRRARTPKARAKALGALAEDIDSIALVVLGPPRLSVDGELETALPDGSSIPTGSAGVDDPVLWGKAYSAMAESNWSALRTVYAQRAVCLLASALPDGPGRSAHIQRHGPAYEYLKAQFILGEALADEREFPEAVEAVKAAVLTDPRDPLRSAYRAVGVACAAGDADASGRLVAALGPDYASTAEWARAVDAVIFDRDDAADLVEAAASANGYVLEYLREGLPQPLPEPTRNSVPGSRIEAIHIFVTLIERVVGRDGDLLARIESLTAPRMSR